MKLAGQIKPVGYFQANASRIIKDIIETRNPLVLTVNGEGRVVVQDIDSYQETQDSLRMLHSTLFDKQVSSPASTRRSRVRGKGTQVAK